MSNSGAQPWERVLQEKFAFIGIDRNYHDLDLAGLGEDLQNWSNDHPGAALVAACFVWLLLPI